MAEEQLTKEQLTRERLTRETDAVLQQQYLRALSSFEGIILSQIDIKNKLGARLNYSIQAGIFILGAIALSILVLLLTLSAQITRISSVVNDMNLHFTSVAEQMHQVRGHMAHMEQRIALLEEIQDMTKVMSNAMEIIDSDMGLMRDTVHGINRHVATVRNNVGNISVNMDLMSHEVQAMSREMHHVAKPARTMNKMFPFP
ncbi:MAG: hypothetical protein LGR52_11660 [Candidatus Thiosymbion ectosymbiont of Robbea hypermnestra]|nr:hypothetical protein [Candidatus Thiosymbion ectosymbiont of Robbea hypermnestra]